MVHEPAILIQKPAIVIEEQATVLHQHFKNLFRLLFNGLK